MWQCPSCNRSFAKNNQHHYCIGSASVDAYIAAQAETLRPLLESIRKTIRLAAPEAEETIAWQMPTYRMSENLIHFAAAKNHIGIYPGEEAVHVFGDRLKDLQASKGTIRLPLDRPLDLELIKDLTVFRVSQVNAQGKETGK